MAQQRCSSSFCIVGADSVRGRLFTPADNAEGMAKLWCPECIKIGKQLTFFASQTAEMIRNLYKAYRPDDLPPEVRLLFTQFAREIIAELGEEL